MIQQLEEELIKLPNSTHPRTISYGSEIKQLLVHKSQHELSSNKLLGFHDISKQIRQLRMEHLSNYTGHKSYYLMGDLATLEQALINYAVNYLCKNGFELISVPDILPNSIIRGCGMQTEGERTQVSNITHEFDISLCVHKYMNLFSRCAHSLFVLFFLYRFISLIMANVCLEQLKWH